MSCAFLSIKEEATKHSAFPKPNDFMEPILGEKRQINNQRLFRD
jgi:hypothetical protein